MAKQKTGTKSVAKPAVKKAAIKKVPAKMVVKKAPVKKAVVVSRPAPKTVVKREPIEKKAAAPKIVKTLALAADKRILTAEGWKRARAGK